MLRDVTWYDDSKGTNQASTLGALDGFAAGRLLLILGGRFKGGELEPLARAAAAKARHTYLIGEAAPVFAIALAQAGAAFTEAGTLEQAVALAAAEARPGDAVLLSPACASFDQFANYHQRGLAFQRLVHALPEERRRWRRKLAFDRLLFTAVVVLVGLGLVVVYSASGPMAQRSGMEWNGLFVKQAMAALIGFGCMLIVMHLDYRLLKKPEVLYPALFVVFVLLIVVLFSPEINGSRRWLRIAGFSLQPSEIAKLLVVPYVAYQIDKKKDRLGELVFLLPTLGIAGLTALLVLTGKDLGTASMIGAPALLMIFLAGISLRWVLGGAAVLLPMAATIILSRPTAASGSSPSSIPRRSRSAAASSCFSRRSRWARAASWASAPGNSLQKLHYLPSPHADFVFAIIGEEYGFFGSLLFIGLFGVVLWRGILAGLNAPDTFGRYLAWGFTAMLVLQATVHMSVGLGLVPTTGVPLPLISHGGTAMVMSLIAAGWILNVSQHG